MMQDEQGNGDRKEGERYVAIDIKSGAGEEGNGCLVRVKAV